MSSCLHWVEKGFWPRFAPGWIYHLLSSLLIVTHWCLSSQPLVTCSCVCARYYGCQHKVDRCTRYL